jgi:hypothetical protein
MAYKTLSQTGTEIQTGGRTEGGWGGWIKMSGFAADNSLYGVRIDSSGKSSGYAWGGQILGWIDFTDAFDYVTLSCVAGSTCLDGQVCSADGTCPPSICVAGFVCPDGQVCGADGTCPPSLPQCASDTQCFPGKCLGTGQCSSSCSNAAECPSGLCVDGSCAVCSALNQCSFGQQCTAGGQCVGSCSSGADCPSGVCGTDGFCVPISLNEPSMKICSIGTDCLSGICGENGYCVPVDPNNPKGEKTNYAASLYIVPPSAVIDTKGNTNDHKQFQSYYDFGTGGGPILSTNAPGMVWASSDNSIATVSSGYVQAETSAENSVNVTASYNGLIATTTIVLMNPCSPRLTLSSQLINLAPGKSKTITASYGVPAGCQGTSNDVTNQTTFVSRNSAIANVGGNTITGVAEGNTEIDAVYNGKTASVIVAVFYSSGYDRECAALGNPSFGWDVSPTINRWVQFTATGGGNSWNWSFTGAMPLAPTGKVVNVKFNTSGKSSVTLKVSDGSNSCTISRTLNSGGRVEQ